MTVEQAMITKGARPAALSRDSIASVILRAALLTTAISTPAQAVEAYASERRIADEPALSACIARSASGRRWLERTLWGLRDQEGGWVGAEVPNSDGSHDLGPLQVNSWWVPRLAVVTGRPEAHVRYWLKQDACFNVEAARWIFLSGLAVTRDYWKAVGVYHSPTGWRQRRYTSSVVVHLRRRFGKQIFVAGTTGRTVP
jgi:hypothetical protein